METLESHQNSNAYDFLYGIRAGQRSDCVWSDIHP